MSSERLFINRLSLLIIIAAGLLFSGAFVRNVRAANAFASRQSPAPFVRICLPERFRLLTNQQFDLRIETYGIKAAPDEIKITLDDMDVTRAMPAPEFSTHNDMDDASDDSAWVYRKWNFSQPGTHVVRVTVTPSIAQAVKPLASTVSLTSSPAAPATFTATAFIGVQDFTPDANRKNIILMIGDAMGTAYRDAARIVAGSTNKGMREGFFDRMLAMDEMPVSGMVMTHALDRLTPDSANTASAWATGNKTSDGALGVLPDNNDARFKPSQLQATKRYALDNPRIETLWEYLKRLHGYRTGIVTTADLTDATPAAHGAHVSTRLLAGDIARQYVNNPFTGRTVFDVMLGGGRERFTARTYQDSGDTRDLAAELQTAGWMYVQTRTELKSLLASPPTSPAVSPATSSAVSPAISPAASSVTMSKMPDKLLGLFRKNSMNLAFDKLNLPRPEGDAKPNFDGALDQPFLDEMTAAALAVLARDDDRPFILMIEAANIDKQSHSNNHVGQIWETIEFDRAVAVARRSIAHKTPARSLLIVTADHDQSMSIIGVTDTGVAGNIESVRSTSAYPANASAANGDNGLSGGLNPGEVEGFPDYTDADRDGYPENNNRLRLTVGYRTANHTGSSVPLTAEGAGAILFTGYQDQTDLFFKMARILAADTTTLDRALDERARFRIVSPNYATPAP